MAACRSENLQFSRRKKSRRFACAWPDTVLRTSERTNAALHRVVVRTPFPLDRNAQPKFGQINGLPVLIKFSLQLEAGYANAVRMTDGKRLAATLPVDFSNPAGEFSMKRTLTGIAALTSLLATPAFAADLPTWPHSKAPLYAAPS